MEFLLKLLSTVWFIGIWGFSISILASRLNVEKRKLATLDVGIMALETLIIGVGLNSIWFGSIFDLY